MAKKSVIIDVPYDGVTVTLDFWWPTVRMTHVGTNVGQYVVASTDPAAGILAANLPLDGTDMAVVYPVYLTGSPTYIKNVQLPPEQSNANIMTTPNTVIKLRSSTNGSLARLVIEGKA